MTLPDAAPRAERGKEVLVEFPQDELIAKWEEFFEETGYLSKIIAIADRYPEERSLEVLFEEMNRFDTDMAIYLLRHPLNVLTAGEEAIRRLVPPGEEAALIHLRIKGLPRDRRVPIRSLRAKHLGQYIAAEGLVRKSTEVRPRVTDALFQCLRCGTIIKEPQDGQNFREPLECYEEQGGCKRSASATKFRLMTETSLYLDTQKLEIQESPEGLRGGEEPQRLTLYLEDDLTGRINPGERVIMNGVLRSVQKGRPGAKSTLFDIFMDVNSVEKEQVEFEEIEVTEEDARLIREAGSNPDIFRLMTASIAPSLYGMYVEKEALALQLFSGVPKTMPDGRRIRGDLHLLLVGDPGTGKSELLSYMSRLSPRGIYATGKAATAAGLCVAADSLIATDRGVRSIEEVAEPFFYGKERLRPVETAGATGSVVTLDNRHRSEMRPLEAVWRLKPPAAMLRVTTVSGLSLAVTPATKLLVDHAMGQSWIQAKYLRPGMRVATTRRLEIPDDAGPLLLSLLRPITTRIVVSVEPALIDSITAGLKSRYGTLREAATRLMVPEGSLYYGWRDGRHDIPLAPLLAAAHASGISEAAVAQSIRTYSQAGGHRISLPERLNEDLAYFAGLIAGDGSVEPGRTGGVSIRYSNSNPVLIDTYKELVGRLFSATYDFTPQSLRRAATVRFHSKLVATILAELGVPTSPKSNRLTLPGLLLNGPASTLAAYLRGLYDTDGTIQVRAGGNACLSLTTASRILADRVHLALVRFGIHAVVRVRRVPGRRATRSDGRSIVTRLDEYVLDIRDWRSLSRFREIVGLNHPRKREILDRVKARRPHSNLDLIAGAGPHLREVRRLMGLSPEQAYGSHEGGSRALEQGVHAATRESLLEHVAGLEAAYAQGTYRGMRIRLRSDLRSRIPEVLRSAGLTGVSVAGALGLPKDRIHDAFYRRSRRPPRMPLRLLRQIAELLEPHDEEFAAEIRAEINPLLRRVERIPSRIEFLRLLASGDIRWEPIEDICVETSSGDKAVFDLTVKEAHAFAANGILVHNTAAAVRDEFGEGRWTLEAGALVLADLGLACLHPRAEVLVNGVPRAVEELFDSSRAMPAIAGGKEIEIAPAADSTVTFNPAGATASENVIASIVRRRYRGPIAFVKLSSGFELRLTPDHIVLDGETFEWRSLRDLRPNARLVAVQRLPPGRKSVYVLDIVPDAWIIQPTKAEKDELRANLLKRFATLSEANRRYGMSRDALSGRGAIRISVFRRLLHDLGLYETWKERPFAFGRSRSTERLRVATITPELAYLMGFICGDGHVSMNKRRSNLSIFQSKVHARYIQRVMDMTGAVSSRPWGVYAREMTSTIRGTPTRSSCVHMHRGSNLLALVFAWLMKDDLANLLALDDTSIKGFVAGLVDSDGCVSLKSSGLPSRSYETVDISIMFSASVRANQHLLYALRRFDVFARIRRAMGVLYVQITSREDARRLLDAIFPYSAKWKALPMARSVISAEHEEMPSNPTREILRRARPRPWSLLEKGLWSTLHDLSNGKRRPFKQAVRRLTEAIRPHVSPRDYRALRSLTSADYALDRIAQVRIEHHDGYVYDLRVPGHDDFLCDGAVVHNCIDEIEKMNPQDRSAIHEAMEQQRISVAKAGITAVLQSRCAILAAANPKFGRFDEHKYISEQIDLPPALLSRFDIIFSMIDRPQAERDRELAQHVLKGHRVGEIARRRETGAATPMTEDLEIPYTPHFSPDFLRKYVAYAKRIYPVMTDEAMGIIERKYLEIRKTGEAAGSSVPITPRQLEAIIRLSEAGARLRLSEAVTGDDAERAVRIVEYWMGKVAGEEGRFDIDIIQTGISQSQREQIISIRDIISELAGPEGVADYEDIVRIAQERGIPPAKVDSWLKRWAQEGEIYSPAKNKYKLVERL